MAVYITPEDSGVFSVMQHCCINGSDISKEHSVFIFTGQSAPETLL
jgi:hypothetical protein